MSARRRATYVALVPLLACLAVFTVGCKDPGPPKPRTSGSKAQDESRKKQIKEQFSTWDGSHKGLTKYVKQSLDNPLSFEHVSTRFEDRLIHLIVTMSFTSKNAAGNVVKGSIVAKVDLNGRIIEIVSRR